MIQHELTDDDIRTELKRMLSTEKSRILSEFDQVEREFAENPELPPDRREQLVAEMKARMQDGREFLERTMKAFADFIDRREQAAP